MRPGDQAVSPGRANAPAGPNHNVLPLRKAHIMATRNVIQAPVAATPPLAEPNPTGYLCENFIGLETPALRVNPDATPGDLVAWCWAEVTSLEATAHAVAKVLFSEDPSLHPPEAFDKMFLHRLRPLRDVLEHAAVLIYRDQEARQQGR